jgi:V8-like Glu-specific endopeptidase
LLLRIPLVLLAPMALTTALAAPASAQVDLAYRTPDRMAAATPLDARHTVRSHSSARRSAHTWTGSPVVGALFLSNGGGAHYCTASVVDTPKKSLILTAAHCLYGSGGWARNAVFVPRYSRGSRPYGTWKIRYMYVDSQWKRKRDPNLDVGFAAVGTRKGKRLANVVGAERFVTGAGYTQKVRVIGYPMKKYASADKPIYCNATTHKAFKYQMRFDCGGFYGGTSGSPWIKNYNTRTRRGEVFGVIGGYQEGGKYDWRSYSPAFGGTVHRLFRDAQVHG